MKNDSTKLRAIRTNYHTSQSFNKLRNNIFNEGTNEIFPPKITSTRLDRKRINYSHGSQNIPQGQERHFNYLNTTGISNISNIKKLNKEDHNTSNTNTLSVDYSKYMNEQKKNLIGKKKEAENSKNEENIKCTKRFNIKSNFRKTFSNIDFIKKGSNTVRQISVEYQNNQKSSFCANNNTIDSTTRNQTTRNNFSTTINNFYKLPYTNKSINFSNKFSNMINNNDQAFDGNMFRDLENVSKADEIEKNKKTNEESLRCLDKWEHTNITEVNTQEEKNLKKTTKMLENVAKFTKFVKNTTDTTEADIKIKNLKDLKIDRQIMDLKTVTNWGLNIEILNFSKDKISNKVSNTFFGHSLYEAFNKKRIEKAHNHSKYEKNEQKFFGLTETEKKNAMNDELQHNIHFRKVWSDVKDTEFVEKFKKSPNTIKFMKNVEYYQKYEKESDKCNMYLENNVVHNFKCVDDGQTKKFKIDHENFGNTLKEKIRFHCLDYQRQIDDSKKISYKTQLDTYKSQRLELKKLQKDEKKQEEKIKFKKIKLKDSVDAFKFEQNDFELIEQVIYIYFYFFYIY